MMKRCPACSSYTMEEKHCGKTSISVHPAKYSPLDKWKEYRRKGYEE